ncbi:MAG: diphthamide biosynthesis enzyme Dph2, partial [Candidatus Aenigmatarchaeota archaeon]
YGACDIKTDEARKLGCQKIVHYGHTRFCDSNFPVEYVEYREKADAVPILERNYDLVRGFKSIGFVSSLQFSDAIPPARYFLEKKGHKVFVGEVNGKKHLYPGQVLGCDVSNATAIEDKVDAFLFLGCGKFHPLGLSLKQNKPIFALDFEKGNISKVDDSLFRKQKVMAKALAKDARIFGILVSTKQGQMNMKLAEELKRKLESAGRTAFILALDEIRPEKLTGIKADCWVNTACPRIAIENRTEFKLIVNPDELGNIV